MIYVQKCTNFSMHFMFFFKFFKVMFIRLLTVSSLFESTVKLVSEISYYILDNFQPSFRLKAYFWSLFNIPKIHSSKFPYNFLRFLSKNFEQNLMNILTLSFPPIKSLFASFYTVLSPIISSWYFHCSTDADKYFGFPTNVPSWDFLMTILLF